MTERKHELTDQDIRELVSRDWTDTTERNIDAALAALKSRRPVDPDAGLGVTWELAEKYNRTAVLIDAEMAALVYGCDENSGKYNEAAVARAILAAPKAIKLARALAASEVLSIVDGSDQHG